MKGGRGIEARKTPGLDEEVEKKARMRDKTVMPSAFI